MSSIVRDKIDSLKYRTLVLCSVLEYFGVHGKQEYIGLIVGSVGYAFEDDLFFEDFEIWYERGGGVQHDNQRDEVLIYQIRNFMGPQD